MPEDRQGRLDDPQLETGPLAGFPRTPLGHLPTPLEALPRLSAELAGPEIWVKRDDCTGLGLGGNKVRKLEYLMGEAQAQGARTVITVGGVQSNHARQTAAAAARLGLRCELVLPRVVPRSGTDYERSGNVLLDELFGAEVFIVDDEEQAARAIQARVEAAEERGEPAVVHPPGGSTPTGALGYVRAALECDAQMQAEALAFERIYLAVGTGGTLAGLLCGFQLAARAVSIRGVCVAHPAHQDRSPISVLAGLVCEALGQPQLPDEAIELTDTFLGEAYGVPTREGLEAISLCARSEGLLLDPVYTSKAMAALVDDAKSGALGDGPVLFWHTGGAPALFAYRSELAPDDPAGSG